MLDALCREHPDVPFFIEHGASNKAAKAICARCPVSEECLEFGMDERAGIWGGTTPDERKALRRQACRRPIFHDDTPEQVAILYRVGVPIHRLANYYEVAQTTVRNALIDVGVEIRTSPAPGANVSPLRTP